MKKLISKFINNTSGNFAMIVALAMIPIFGTAGAALDYSRASSVKKQMQSATDIAALSAIIEYQSNKSSSKKSRKKLAKKYFKANYNGSVSANSKVKLNKAGNEITITAEAKVPTTFLSIVGINTLDTAVESQAAVGLARLHIALVVDATGSMNSNNKLTLMKQAASDFIDNILPLGNPSGNLVEFGLVPFTTVVRVEESWKNEWWLDLGDQTTGTFKGCLWDRSVSWDSTDKNPQSGVSDTYYQASPNSLRETSKCNNMSKIVGLTENRNKIKSNINAISAGGNTNTALGMVWGKNILSNSLPYDDKDDASKRIIIFLTDGQNTDSRMVHEGGNSNDIDTATSEICTEAKSNDIEIYALRVMNGNATMLKNCASKDDNYYNLTDASQLTGAFESISSAIWENLVSLRK